MDEEDNEDRIIRERKFKIDFDVQLEGIDIKNETVENTEKIKQDKDEALGDLFDPFQDDRDDAAGVIQKDGKIKNAPVKDIVTEISIEGERRINWSIMVTMIFIYSIISFQVGNTFSPFSNHNLNFIGWFWIYSWRNMDTKQKNGNAWSYMGHNFNEGIIWTNYRV